jgi:short-subunit dehydrogenase
MVSLTEVSIANAKIATLLPPGLVAVFVGGTSGIGEFTLKALAKRAVRPRIYIVGRSEEAAERIKKECAALNPRGEYIFIPKDVSLIGNVDELCREIASREKFINILVVSAGTLVMGVGKFVFCLGLNSYSPVSSLQIPHPI